MILADVSYYFHPSWQVPLASVAVVAMLYLGGRVLRKSLAKHAAQTSQSQTNPNKVTLARCCLAVFLAIVAAFVCAWAVKYLVDVIGAAHDAPASWWVPLALGAIAAIPAFALVIMAMFSVPLGQLLPGTGKALGVVVVITAICGSGIGVPAYFELAQHIEQAESKDHLNRIFGYLQDVSTRFTKATPGDLVSLKKINTFNPDILKSSRRPGLDVGYFYYSPGSEAMLKANPLRSRSAIAVVPEGGEGLLACEFKGSRNDGRLVLMRNGNVVPMTEDEFQENLNKKINEDFRKALAKAEK